MEQFKFHGYIYITICQQSRKCYVGQKAHPPDKTKNYLGSGSYFKKAVKKYGKKFFKKIVLGEIFSNDIQDFKNQLDEYEEECIYFFRAFGADGVNYDEIYGYNLVREPKTNLGIPSEIRKEAGKKLSKKLKDNPEISISRGLKLSETLKDNPDILLNREIKRLETERNNPEIQIQRTASYKETLKNNPEINTNKGIKISEIRNNFSDEKWEEIGDKYRQHYIDNPEQKAKEVKHFKQLLKDDPTILENIQINRNKTLEENPQIMRGTANKAWNTKRNNPEQLIENNKKIGITRTLNNIAVGTKSHTYKKLNYIFLIQCYLSNIYYDDMFKKYTKEIDDSVKYRAFYKFFKILNFPSNRCSNNKNKRELYLNFVEENKHKIDWYIENYERLEEEYYEKRHYEKHKELFEKNNTNK